MKGDTLPVWWFVGNHRLDYAAAIIVLFRPTRGGTTTATAEHAPENAPTLGDETNAAGLLSVTSGLTVRGDHALGTASFRRDLGGGELGAADHRQQQESFNSGVDRVHRWPRRVGTQCFVPDYRRFGLGKLKQFLGLIGSCRFFAMNRRGDGEDWLYGDNLPSSERPRRSGRTPVDS